MSDDLRPPAQIEPFVRVLGVDDTIKFISEFGGVEIYIARNPTARSRIVAVMGREKAEALARMAEGGEWPARIPLVKPWCAAVMKAKGLPVSDIARILRTTDVTVRKWLSPAPKNDPRVGSSRVDLQACKLEYSIVSPK